MDYRLINYTSHDATVMTKRKLQKIPQSRKNSVEEIGRVRDGDVNSLNKKSTVSSLLLTATTVINLIHVVCVCVCKRERCILQAGETDQGSG